MSDQWLVKCTWSAFSISPTYCMAHLLHSIKYTTFLVPQSAVAFTRNCVLLVVLLNGVPVPLWAHALQHGCLHGLLPLYISLWCSSATLTERFLRLGGRWYAKRGCSGLLLKLCAGCSAVKHSAHSFMGTCFTAWMFTRPITPVCFSLVFKRRSDQKVPEIRRTVIC